MAIPQKDQYVLRKQGTSQYLNTCGKGGSVLNGNPTVLKDLKKINWIINCYGHLGPFELVKIELVEVEVSKVFPINPEIHATAT